MDEQMAAAPNEAAQMPPSQEVDAAAKDYESAGFGTDEEGRDAGREANRSEGGPERESGPEAEGSKSDGKTDAKAGAFTPEDFRDVFPELEGDAEGSAVNAEMAKLCAEVGISPDAMKPVVDRFYDMVRESAAAREQADMEAGKKAMADMWGVKARENSLRVMQAVALVDGRLGEERFSQALAATGAANNVDVIAGMYELARMMGEATLGGALPGAGGENAESPESAYAKWFK